jgi:hypothetical protein
MSFKISPTEGHPESKGWKIETTEFGIPMVTEFSDARDAASKITNLHSLLLAAYKREQKLSAKICAIEDIIDTEED